MACRVVRRLIKKPQGKILRDDIIVLKNKKSKAAHPLPMRRVVALVEVDGKEVEMEFITNNLDWSPASVCDETIPVPKTAKTCLPSLVGVLPVFPVSPRGIGGKTVNLAIRLRSALICASVFFWLSVSLAFRAASRTRWRALPSLPKSRASARFLSIRSLLFFSKTSLYRWERCQSFLPSLAE